MKFVIIHSKYKTITHKLTNHEIPLVFSLRTRTVRDFKSNFPFQDKENINCPLCGETEDTQEHCLSCDKLKSDTITHNYEDIYSDDLNKQINITRLFSTLLEERRQLIETQLTSGQVPVDPDYTVYTV